MTVESLIGITSGLIGIGGFMVAAWTAYRKLSLASSLEKLTDKNFSTIRHRRILNWINFGLWVKMQAAIGLHCLLYKG